MFAMNWINEMARNRRLIIALGLLFLASPLIAEAANAKPAKRRVPSAKTTAKKTTPVQKPAHATKSYDIDF